MHVCTCVSWNMYQINNTELVSLSLYLYLSQVWMELVCKEGGVTITAFKCLTKMASMYESMVREAVALDHSIGQSIYMLTMTMCMSLSWITIVCLCLLLVEGLCRCVCVCVCVCACVCVCVISAVDDELIHGVLERVGEEFTKWVKEGEREREREREWRIKSYSLQSLQDTRVYVWKCHKSQPFDVTDKGLYSAGASRAWYY